MAKAVRIAVENALRDRQVADVKRLLAEMVEYQEAIDRIRLFNLDLAPTLVSSQLSIGDDVPADALRQVITGGQPRSLADTRHGRPLLYHFTPIRDPHGLITGALELVQVATRAHERIGATNRDIVIRLALLVISIPILAGLMLQRQVLHPLARLMDGIRSLHGASLARPSPSSGATSSGASRKRSTRWRPVSRGQARRLNGCEDIAVCNVCREKLQHAGAVCARCQSAVRGESELWVFLGRYALRHLECGAVRLEGALDTPVRSSAV